MKFIKELLEELSNVDYRNGDRDITVHYRDKSITFDSRGMDPDDIEDKVDDIFNDLKAKYIND